MSVPGDDAGTSGHGSWKGEAVGFLPRYLSGSWPAFRYLLVSVVFQRTIWV